MYIFLRLLMFMCLVSCNSGGSSGSSSSNVIKISQTISDSTLVNFEQTSGVAKVDKQWIDYIIARAYAATGNINCLSGSSVSFDMDIQLGSSTENIQINAKCGADIELKVRQGMLSALNGHIMMREKGQTATGIGYWLDFSGNNFAFGVPFTILQKTGWTRHSDQVVINNAYWLNQTNCYVDYTFNYDTGTVSNNALTTSYADRARSKNEVTNTNNSIANPNNPSNANSYEGCNSSNVNFQSSDFRFKNGKIEIDESGRKDFNPNGCALWNDATGVMLDYNTNVDGSGNCLDSGYDSTYERFCIDDNGNGACDTI